MATPKEIKGEYTLSEWMAIRKAAKSTGRSLRNFQKAATLAAARKENRRTASPGGKESEG